MGVVIYTRSAVPNLAEQEWQSAACEELAADLGYEVTRTYHDEGRARPALDELMSDAASGEVSVLLVAKFDRLSRSSSESSRITAALLDAGVDIYAANIGTRPLNDPSTYIVQVMAAMRISDHVRGRYDSARGRRPRGRI